jgi:DNA-binding transcriptional MocR family regulator
VALSLDGRPMPPPFASFARDAITIGSASKAFWGGLRLGWIRAPEARVAALTQSRLSLDLGAPVLEQLVLTRLLRDPEPILVANRERLREQRDRLAAALRSHLPEWRFRLPTGGLALWCELPAPLATGLVAEAERRGVVVAPGSVFAVEGGLERFVRIPWTRPAEELEQAVLHLAEAWVVARDVQDRRRRPRITVA